MLEVDRALLAFHGPAWEHFGPTYKQEERIKMIRALGVINDFQEETLDAEEYELLKNAIRIHLWDYMDTTNIHWDKLETYINTVTQVGQSLNVIPKEFR